jgi:transketolase
VDKLEAFGFHTQSIDGHDFEAIEAAMEAAKAVKGRPSAIVMKTVKGKDVSFMENLASWHGVAPNDEQYQQAMSELKAKLSELEGK